MSGATTAHHINIRLKPKTGHSSLSMETPV
jgi:hypothetical protein